MTTPLNSYSTGTVSVNADGTTVTGSSTIWSSAGNVKPGDLFQSGHFLATITDVTDDTHLVITPWPGSTLSAAAYVVWKVSQQRIVGETYARSVDQLVSAMDTSGFFVFVNVNQTAPDPSLGDDGQYAFQPTTGAYWLKTGGVWVASGAPSKGYGGTSATSLAIGTGSKVFTTQAGLAYQNGARVRATSNGDVSKWMEGVATYSGTTLTIDVDNTNGSGTSADWNLNVAGQPGDMLSSIYDPNSRATDAFNSANTDYISAATGAVARSVQNKLRDVLSLRDFGIMGDGITDVTSAMSAAFDAAEALDVPLYAPTGRYIMSAEINKTFSNRFVLLTDGRGKTIFEWVGDTNGLVLTYLTESKPPYVGSISLHNSSATTNATALFIEGLDFPSSWEEGPVIDNVEIKGADETTDFWTQGIYIKNCWYPTILRPVLKGKDGEDTLPAFSMQGGIISETNQAMRVRDADLQHIETGFATIGTYHGEGLSIIGGEWVGVRTGISHKPPATTAGSVIANIHINAYYRNVVLENVAELTLHDCLFYKTHVSTEDWQAVEMSACYWNDIHDNIFATPGVDTFGGGTQNGVTLVNSYDNRIHSNMFCQWGSGGGAGIYVLAASDANSIYNNKRPHADSFPNPFMLFDATAGLANRTWRNDPVQQRNLPVNDATPSVGNSTDEFWRTANTSTTTITNFDDGYPGQRVTVMINDSHTAWTHSSGFRLKSGSNITTGTGQGFAISFIYDGLLPGWTEVGRGF